MNENVCNFLMLAAAAVGRELTPVEQMMLNKYLRR